MDQAPEPAPTPSPRRLSLGLYVRLALGLLLIWLVFRGTDWSEVAAACRALDPAWLAVTFLCTFSAQFARVQRGVYVVRAATPASYGVIFRSAMMALLLNLVVPLRLGDATRAVVLARNTRIPTSRSLMLVALDRLSDLVGLLVLVGLVLVCLPMERTIELPAELLPAGTTLTLSEGLLGRAAFVALLFVLAAAAGLVLLFVRPAWVLRAVDVLTAPLPDAVGRRAHRIVENLEAGLHVLRSPAAMAASMAFSLLGWGLGVTMLGSMIRAFGIQTEWTTPLLMQAMLAAFIFVPLAPGLVGQFHLPIVACLLMAVPDVSVSTAKAVALMTHLVGVFPLVVLGGYSILRERAGPRPDDPAYSST